MTQITNKPSVSFWIIGVLTLIWNAIGSIAYLGQKFMTEDIKSAIHKDQLEIIQNTPAWATAAFAFAVWFGLLASIFLLIRKKWATNFFMISFAGVFVQLIYNIFFSKAFEVYGTAGVVQALITVSISIFLIWYSRKCTDDGILT